MGDCAPLRYVRKYAEIMECNRYKIFYAIETDNLVVSWNANEWSIVPWHLQNSLTELKVPLAIKSIRYALVGILCSRGDTFSGKTFPISPIISRKVTSYVIPVPMRAGVYVVYAFFFTSFIPDFEATAVCTATVRKRNPTAFSARERSSSPEARTLLSSPSSLLSSLEVPSHPGRRNGEDQWKKKGTRRKGEGV